VPFVWWVKTDSTGRIVEECYTVRPPYQGKFFKNVQQVRDELAKHTLPDLDTPKSAPAARAPQPAEGDEPDADRADDPGWCPIHECEMKRRTKDGDVWYSHKTDEGDYCRGGREEKRKPKKR
jgi:hypothetical protein